MDTGNPEAAECSKAYTVQMGGDGVSANFYSIIFIVFVFIYFLVNVFITL
jgi:hypothetical protein